MDMDMEREKLRPLLKLMLNLDITAMVMEDMDTMDMDMEREKLRPLLKLILNLDITTTATTMVMDMEREMLKLNQGIIILAIIKITIIIVTDILSLFRRIYSLVCKSVGHFEMKLF